MGVPPHLPLPELFFQRKKFRSGYQVFIRGHFHPDWRQASSYEPRWPDWPVFRDLDRKEKFLACMRGWAGSVFEISATGMKISTYEDSIPVTGDEKVLDKITSLSQQSGQKYANFLCSLKLPESTTNLPDKSTTGMKFLIWADNRSRPSNCNINTRAEILQRI